MLSSLKTLELVGQDLAQCDKLITGLYQADACSGLWPYSLADGLVFEVFYSSVAKLEKHCATLTSHSFGQNDYFYYCFVSGEFHDLCIC